LYSNTDIEKLLDIIKRNSEGILNRILLFGSYANNTQRDESDLDIAIITDSYLDRKEKHNILNKLWWESSSNGFSVDFIIKSLVDFEAERDLPTLSRTISREGIILWQKN
jgi:predicted nucleotidyltransferase